MRENADLATPMAPIGAIGSADSAQIEQKLVKTLVFGALRHRPATITAAKTGENAGFGARARACASPASRRFPPT
jgi:hypothetical protein